MAAAPTRFRFAVAAYEAGPWIERCLKSIQSQTVGEFRCMVIDDQSADDTLARARATVAGDERFTVEVAEPKAYALGNRVAIVRAIATEPEDVVIVVDGDDWLAHDRVLETLGRVYADPDVWLTYGSHLRWKDKLLHRLGLKKRRGIAARYPDVVSENNLFRYHTFLGSHLRTFRRFLYDGIRDEDLRDEDGGYLKTAGDVADTIPMLEMAGPQHIRFIDEILYVYNNSNVLSDHRAHGEAQLLTNLQVRARPRYALLQRDAADAEAP